MPGTIQNDPETYHRLLKLVNLKCTQYPGAANLCFLITGKMILAYLSGKQPQSTLEDYVNKHFTHTYESVYAQLLADCKNYCSSKLDHSDAAHDIAQEAIMSLINSKQKIEDISSWLHRVCHNLIYKYFRERSANKELIRCLRTECLTSCPGSSNPLEDEMPNISQIPELRDSKEYLTLCEIHKYTSLFQYAQAKGISLSKAKQISKQYKRDLRARFLRYSGWTHTPVILDYNQYKAVQRYYRKILELMKGSESSHKRKNSCHFNASEIFKCFQSTDKAIEWNINHAKDNIYDLSIIVLDANQIPAIVMMEILFKANHRIETLSCKRLVPYQCITVENEVNIPMEKGMCPLSEEEVIAHICRFGNGQVSVIE